MTIPPIDLTALKDGLPATEASTTIPLNNLQTALNNLIVGDAAWDQLNYGQDTKTISSDAITVTKTYNVIDTEGAAASDNLATINGGNDGDILILIAANAGRIITLKNGTGNIVTSTNADITLSSTRALMLFKSGSYWSDLSVPVETSVNQQTFQARMTLTSGISITTSDVTAATTVYITPFLGNKVALYYNSAWHLYTLSELAVSLGGGTITANTLWDVFIYWNGSSISAELQSWASANARSVALTTQDGVLVKNGAVTRRYIGTFRTTGTTGQTEDSKQHRYLWNYYNRVNRLLSFSETTSHVYATAAWRAWNNSTANRYDYIVGLLEEAVSAQISARWGGGSSEVAVSSALNSAVVGAAASDPYTDWLGGTIVTFGDAAFQMPALGYNFNQIMQFGGASVTFYSARITGMVRG